MVNMGRIDTIALIHNCFCMSTKYINSKLNLDWVIHGAIMAIYSKRTLV